MMARKYHVSRFHRFYRIVTTQRGCVYCGVRATTKDHFVPISVLALVADAIDEVSGKVLVPACGECNSIAGKNVFPTIAAKRRFIQDGLRRKYRSTLAIPAWSDSQLAELGYGLADFVRSGIARKQWLMERLQWRNTSNREPVKLARVRSPFTASGKGSATRLAAKSGTINNDLPSLSHTGE